jgi:hypothetical protein
MKKYELVIVVTVKDDVKPSDFSLYDHDVCDGFEVLLPLTDDFKIAGFELKDVKELKPTTKEDVLEVAKSLDMLELSESQINWVILSYEDAQRQDPTATFNLIVEDLLYQLKNNFE